jgi:hypothetical protein
MAILTYKINPGNYSSTLPGENFAGRIIANDTVSGNTRTVFLEAVAKEGYEFDRWEITTVSTQEEPINDGGGGGEGTDPNPETGF